MNSKTFYLRIESIGCIYHLLFNYDITVKEWVQVQKFEQERKIWDL